MADLTITPASVLQAAGAIVDKSLTAGEALTAGKVVRADATDGGKAKAATSEGDAAAANVLGVALHAAADEQPIQIQTSGEINLGATLVVGETYFLSTAGGICPVGDLAASDRITRIGWARTAAILVLDIKAYGVQKPA